MRTGARGFFCAARKMIGQSCKSGGLLVKDSRSGGHGNAADE
jgi:hypothetical protein